MHTARQVRQLTHPEERSRRSRARIDRGRRRRARGRQALAGHSGERAWWSRVPSRESIGMRVWWLALLGALARARELDPAACGARFDVQRDKIIRTEESREMGARYLSELDVGARHECLRLCCETDSCDVFVYEEKVALAYFIELISISISNFPTTCK